MNDNQLAEVARILGVSEDSITAMDDEIKNNMTAVFEAAKDKKAVFEALDHLWQKGSVYIELAEVAKSTGITLATLRNLDYETQQTIVYEFMMDSSQTARFYDLVIWNSAPVELSVRVMKTRTYRFSAMSPKARSMLIRIKLWRTSRGLFLRS